jgi:aspartokinase
MTQNNISDRVNSFIDNDFITKKCLSRGIISLRALSRHIIKKLGLKDGNLDAVMSAVRRYRKTGMESKEGSLKKIFSKVSVKTRSDVVDIRVNKNRKSVEGISRLNSIIDVEKGEILRVIQSEQSITIIMDDKNLGKFFNIFGKTSCISIDKKLVEINLQFTGEAQGTKGITSLIASSLNSENINIVEIMSSAPELIVIIKKEDLLKALNVVDKLGEII